MSVSVPSLVHEGLHPLPRRAALPARLPAWPVRGVMAPPKARPDRPFTPAFPPRRLVGRAALLVGA